MTRRSSLYIDGRKGRPWADARRQPRQAANAFRTGRAAARPTAPSKRTERNQPVKEFRHRNLRATIWRNQTDKGLMYNVTLTRMYRDGETWKDSQSFGFDDLMNLSKLLADAHTHISTLRENNFTEAKGKRPAREASGEKHVVPF